MTLGKFALAVGAPRKWVQNAHAVLNVKAVYSLERARIFALLLVLEDALDIPLKRAYELAKRTLEHPDDPGSWQHHSSDGTVTLSIDRDRFMTTFATRLSTAQELYAERPRGRPPKMRRARGVKAAAAYGVDVGLLEDSLRRTPAERLRRLDEDIAFLTSMRIGAR